MSDAVSTAVGSVWYHSSTLCEVQWMLSCDNITVLLFSSFSNTHCDSSLSRFDRVLRCCSLVCLVFALS